MPDEEKATSERVKAKAIVYKGELSQCACSGIKGIWRQGQPVFLLGEGGGPDPGGPVLTLERAEELVAEHRSVGYEYERDKAGQPILDKSGQPKLKQIVSEVFSIVELTI